MNEFNESFLGRAIELARDNVASGRGGPFGAVIVKDGEIVAEAVNMVIETNDPTAHAEILAIRRATQSLGTFELTGCTLYASCEPCPMCLGAIYWAHLRGVYFATTREDAANAGFDDTRIYGEVSRAPENRSIPMYHCMQHDAGAPFEAWLQKRDRVNY